MKSDSHSEQLLNDILGEDAPDLFEGALLEQTLGLVRRRRRWRQCQRGLVVLTIGVLLPLLLWRKPGEPGPISGAKAPASAAFTPVTTVPLNPSFIVETRPGTIPIVISSPGTVAMVESGAGQNLFQEITDDELLLLCQGHSVALVRSGPAQAELLFLSREAQDAFSSP
jgi:hypothetical protein